MRARALLVGLALTTGGCFEFEFTPSYVIQGPTELATRVEVIEQGPWSGALPSIPGGDVRANPLPGERVRIRSYVVDTVGERDLSTEAPAYFLCPGWAWCVDEDWESLPSCDGHPLPLLPGEGCAIDRLAEPAFTLGPLRDLTTSEFENVDALGYFGLYVHAFVGRAERPRTTTCVNRLVNADESLWDCALVRRFVRFQEGQAFLDALEPAGVLLAIPSVELPLEWLAQEPNVHPRLDPTPVEIVGVEGGTRTALAADGSTVFVEPGDTIHVGPPEWRRGQMYTEFLEDNGELFFVTLEEGLERDVSTDRGVTLVGNADESDPTSFILEEGTVTLYITATDRRGGITWASFRLSADEPG